MKALIQKAFTSTTRLWKLIAVQYVCNLGLAILLASGFSSALATGFGDSMLPENLLRGFDATVQGDFMRAYDHLLNPLMTQLWWFLGSYMLLMAILGAGVVSFLANETLPFSLERFLQECGHYFGRMLKLLGLSLMVLVIGGAFALFISGIIFGFVSSGADSEATTVTGFVLATLFFLLFVFLSVLVTDYAKVFLVVEDEKSALRSYGHGVRFVFGNILSTGGWQLFMGVVVVIVSIVYLLIANSFNMATGAGIVIMFLVQQASVASRVWVRVATIGGQIQVHQSRWRVTQLPAVLVAPPEKHETLPATEVKSRSKKSLLGKASRRASAKRRERSR